MHSINGLVYLWNRIGDVSIYNSFTKHVVLQQSQGRVNAPMTCCSFGFDPITKKHDKIEGKVFSKS